MAADFVFADGYSVQVIKRAKIANSSSGDNELVAAVTGYKIRVYDVVLISAGDMTVKFQSGAAGTDLTGPMNVGAGTGFAPGFDPFGHFETASGASLNLRLSTGVAANGWLVYALIPVPVTAT